MDYLIFLVIFAVESTLCWGALYESVADLKKLNFQFDFIVVGGKPCFQCLYAVLIRYISSWKGGTAGNVIANRLTENPRHSVLVFEAGAS
jgi:hypothetical protein